MLRITSEKTGDGTTRYRLDGRLTQAHLGELIRVLGPILGGPGHVAVDVTSVTFVDAQGAQLLKELLARRVRIHGCSSFVAHLLGLPSAP